MSAFFIVLCLLALVALILIIRAFGAWMLRIDEVIKYEKEILEELKTKV